MVAKVAMCNASYSYDIEYSYAVPSQMCDKIESGTRVLVPFGKGNRKRIGFVTRTYLRDTYNEDLKPVLQVIDDSSLVTDELMRLIFWLKENTFCTFYEAYKTVIPSGFAYNYKQHYSLVNAEISEDLSEEEQFVVDFMRNSDSVKEIDAFLEDNIKNNKKSVIESLIDKGVIEETDEFKRRVGDETVKMVALTEDYFNGNYVKKLTKKQHLVVELLEEYDTASVKEVCYMTNVTPTIIKNLVANRIVYEYEYEIFRKAVNDVEIQNIDEIQLNESQYVAYNGISELIDNKKPSGALLHGVTGSGKTAVFMKLIEHAIKNGKSAILMVPEIALTPQMVGKFISYFGETVAIIHSNLSLGQRVDEFKRIKNGEAKIVIGTRSAVFAPCIDLGLIIMDEEGEQSYKSDSAPRYHARDVAIQRCGFNNCVLLMASATPSIETYYYAQKNRYSLFELNERFSGNKLPAVVTVDMLDDDSVDNESLYSYTLVERLKKNLENNEQSILLLNRRGYHTFVTCRDCHTTVECPNCSITLTYHKKNNRMMCHYCGYTRSMPDKCDKCGSDKLKKSGVGTQKAEDELQKLLPDAKILRMDADTTSSKHSYERNFKDFADGKFDIMIGTQMIAKGLDFPNVTLVGVISLDKILFMGDFKSYERTFSLITQVVGRSGRAEKKGIAFLQTFVPDHYVIDLASKQDYKGFYNEEIQIRKTLVYPPFCDLCIVGFSSEFERDVTNASVEFLEILKAYINENKIDIPLRVLGPAQCSVGRINNKFRHRIIIKCKNNKQFRAMMSDVLKNSMKRKSFTNVHVYADINGDTGI
ncbi:MAG: primosomal protein N' [Ruminococcus sp.]|nr:primosomal protein N' [Ruminococcus sp.]